MKQLHRKIEQQKQSISNKKDNIKDDVRNTKEKLGSPAGMSLSTLGGLALGFLLLPKKYRVLKFLFKAYTVATTARQLLDFLPHQPKTRATRRHHHPHSKNLH